MGHRSDKDWETYAGEGAASFRDAKASIQRAKQAWDKWQRDLNGRTLCQFAIDEAKLADSGTAQAGSLSNITLAPTASSVDDEYNNLNIRITGGTGVGQEVPITDYVGSTKVASAIFSTAPDATSTYAIAHVAVHELNAGHGASKEVFDFSDNVASPAQGDRFFAWDAF